MNNPEYKNRKINMPTTSEQHIDIIDNCNLLLNKFAGFDSTDNTPEGRMIAQLTWLKERAENHDLPLPVNLKCWEHSGISTWMARLILMPATQKIMSAYTGKWKCLWIAS